MKKLLNILGLFVVVGFVLSPWVRAQNTQQMLEKLKAYPDVIVYNGKIATLDDKMTTVQAMAVRGRRILLLGTNDEIRSLAGPKTELIDAKGRMVLPGLIDAHTHPHLWGIEHFGSEYDPQFKITYLMGNTVEEIRRQLRPAIEKRAQELGPGKWIIIHFPRTLQREGLGLGKFQREELDAIAPNNPVFLASALQGITNTAGKRVFESEVRIRQDLAGLRIWYFLPQVIFNRKYDVIGEWLKRELIECNAQWGVTTVMTHLEPQDIIKTLNTMDQKGDLPIRWSWVHRTGFTVANDPTEFYRLYGDTRGQGSEYFWNAGVGEEGWDKSSCTTLESRDEYQRMVDNRPDRACVNKESVDYLSTLAAIRAGSRVTHIHANRDKSIDYVIQLVEEAMQGPTGLTLEQIKEMKIGLDHNGWFRADQFPKLAKYGIWLNPQTVYLWQHAEQMRLYYDYERNQKMLMPIKSAIEAGVPYLITTDAHISRTEDELKYDAKMLDWPWGNTIWPFLSSFVIREINGKLLNPTEKIDRVTVLKGYTTRGAEYLLREKDLGSLEVGKLADFIVIDKDYFTVPEKELETIKTLLTAVGGKVVFRSSAY